MLSEPGRSDEFAELRRELYLTATDLDTCERIVFGAEGYDDVPISTAVRASGALPMVYAPVEVKGRELIDGGIVSTTNLDIAVEAGAKLVVVINPLVPFVNDFAGQVRARCAGRARGGSRTWASRRSATRRSSCSPTSGCTRWPQRWEERYPGVDIVLIEPEPTDELMFKTSMMNFTSRVEIARHGFQSVTKHLAGEYEHYREICERHGLEISAKRVSKVVEHFDVEQEETSAWRKILEGTTGALLRQTGSPARAALCRAR